MKNTKGSAAAERLLLQTLAYSSCFHFALTKAELWQRLPYDASCRLSLPKFTRALNRLLERGLVQQAANLFCLSMTDVRQRLTRQGYLSAKTQELERAVTAVRRVPTVRALILTGSTAVGNAKVQDDLDFMVICRSGTLWLTRLWLILVAKWHHKRPLRKDNNAWCFNIYLDEADLLIPPARRSLYEAYEVLQMRYVLDRDQLQQRFVVTNVWLGDYLWFFRQQQAEQPVAFLERQSFWWKPVNYLLYLIQVFYRRLKFGPELFTLTPTQAFFNESRYREQLFAKLNRKLKKLLPQNS